MAVRRKDNKNRNLLDGESQEPNGRYRYRYTDRLGVRHTIYAWKLVKTDKTPPGKREGLSLREKEMILKLDLHEGIDTMAAERLTFNELWERYWSERSGLKKTTLNTANELYKHIKNSIGRNNLKALKYSDLKRFGVYLIEEKGLKLSTVGEILRKMNAVFNLAVRDGYLRTNPCKDVLQDLKVMYGQEKKQRNVLSQQEQNNLVKFVKESSKFKRWHNLIVFLLGTGCRISEMIGLTWDDIDFANNAIHINQQVIYTLGEDGKSNAYISSLKTKNARRDIPMLSEVRTALLRERQKQMIEGKASPVIDGVTSFVFTNRNGNIYSKSGIDETLGRICVAYNKQEEAKARADEYEPLLINHFSAHSLRHTFATRLCENTTDLKTIQSVMGHANITTTMNVYAEATKEKKKATFEELQGKIFA